MLWHVEAATFLRASGVMAAAAVAASQGTLVALAGSVSHAKNGSSEDVADGSATVRTSFASIDDVTRILQLDTVGQTMAGRKFRMTDDVPRRYSVIDAIVALTGKAPNNAPRLLETVLEKNPEVRLFSRRKTPPATSRGGDVAAFSNFGVTFFLTRFVRRSLRKCLTLSSKVPASAIRRWQLCRTLSRS
jgi:hypothetical protein